MPDKVKKKTRISGDGLGEFLIYQTLTCPTIEAAVPATRART